MDKHIKVRVQDGDGRVLAMVRATIPKTYRTKAEPDSAAEVYATGYAGGAADAHTRQAR